LPDGLILAADSVIKKGSKTLWTFLLKGYWLFYEDYPI
jgi:hypothetical protein